MKFTLNKIFEIFYLDEAVAAAAFVEVSGVSIITNILTTMLHACLFMHNLHLRSLHYMKDLLINL